jgi:hypothetical protein
VQVNWRKATARGGTRVTSYTVEFEKADGDFASTTECSMSSNTIYQHRFETDQLYCKVSMKQFLLWGLEYDDLIVIRVKSTAANIDSDWSEVNSTGVRVEDVPQ